MTSSIIINETFAEGDGTRAIRPGDTVVGRTGVKWSVRSVMLLVYGNLRLDVVSDATRRFACYPIDLEEVS